MGTQGIRCLRSSGPPHDNHWARIPCTPTAPKYIRSSPRRNRIHQKRKASPDNDQADPKHLQESRGTTRTPRRRRRTRPTANVQRKHGHTNRNRESKRRVTGITSTECGSHRDHQRMITTTYGQSPKNPRNGEPAGSQCKQHTRSQKRDKSTHHHRSRKPSQLTQTRS